MADNLTFKSSIKGFDKDEVFSYIKQMTEEMETARAQHEQELKDRDKIIYDLKMRIAQKDEQRAQLEDEIETKYKKYIDNYDKIGALIYESQVKGDQMIAKAEEEAGRIMTDALSKADVIVREAEEKIAGMLNEAKAEAAAIHEKAEEEAEVFLGEARRDADKMRTDAERMVADAEAEAARLKQEAADETSGMRSRTLSHAAAVKAAASAEVETTLTIGKEKYARLQAALDESLEMFNAVQKRFRDAYKEVHEIVQSNEPVILDIDFDGDALDADDILDVAADADLKFRVEERIFDTDDEDADDVPVSYRREET
ncbi:MAG: hypothetical protein Q4B73_00375 [Lachnospiraceae bacterium]|nr:hypothetical protein [Lachnospiraceae bacterium]